jgi:hypothetical protein
MKKILGLVGLAVLLFAHAACAKEAVVLLPITGPLTPYEKTELAKAVVAELSAKFDLKHGEAVDRFAKKAFQEESRKKDCDETNCYLRIAEHYHADKIAAVRIVLVAKDSYLLSLHLYDVASGEMDFSEKTDCAECSTGKLKLLMLELARRLLEAKN